MNRLMAATSDSNSNSSVLISQDYFDSSSLGETAIIPPPDPHLNYIWTNQVVNHLATNTKIGNGKELENPSPSLSKLNAGGNTKERLSSEPTNDHHSRNTLNCSGNSGIEGSIKDNENAPPPDSFCLTQDNRWEHQLNLNGRREDFHPPIIAIGGKTMDMAASSDVPTTSSNIGMDYWNGNAFALIPCMRVGGGKHKGTSLNYTNPLEIWAERELKRQKRKQMNRESAKRSRQRKQAEFDDLTKRLAEKEAENENLRILLEREREECKRLTEKNESFQAKLRCDNSGKGILQEHIVAENDSVQEEGKRREMVRRGSNEEVDVHVNIRINNNNPARSSNRGEDRDNNKQAKPDQLNQLISQRRALMNDQPSSCLQPFHINQISTLCYADQE